MDVSMPVMDGLEATKLIRMITDFDSSYIVGLTAHTNDEIKASCFAVGMNNYSKILIHLMLSSD
jgi:CheY-like chemotaxis protein